jgi:hypothetical protein
VLAVYNWPHGSDRCDRITRFIDNYFDRFQDFLKPPYHPSWKTVNIAADVRGWTRYWAAEEKLKRLRVARQQVAPAQAVR